MAWVYGSSGEEYWFSYYCEVDEHYWCQSHECECLCHDEREW